jgi:hypothetical protein
MHLSRSICRGLCILCCFMPWHFFSMPRDKGTLTSTFVHALLFFSVFPPEPLTKSREREMRVGGKGRDESERRRAESQWIVAARPLCHLQYPVAYLSRLQRILPAARWELHFMAARAAHPPHGLHQRHVPLGARRPLLRVGNRAAGARTASGPDSDLEAFSHNPAHGSFAPLAFQPSAMTNCANQRFLSY